tara:strand:- start:227 stop:334 length:108 start_codon:yes stop_codon:yes gene_type:complete
LLTKGVKKNDPTSAILVENAEEYNSITMFEDLEVR